MAMHYNPTIVRDELVLHLDAANPKSYPGSGSTWSDLSGLGNNGTLLNGAAYTTANGGAMTFDGVNDYALAPASFPQSNMTISFWMFLDNTISWTTRFDVLSTDIASGASGRCILYRETETILSYYMLFPSLVPRAVQIANANTLFTGKWKNVAMTSFTSGGSTTMSVYIDGALSGSLNVPEAATATNSSVYLMLNQNMLYPTKGRISTISVYNRALTSVEIQQNFNAIRGRYSV